jgi:hypothetical protein
MKNRNLNQQANLAIIFDQLYQAAQNFLDARKSKSCFYFLFKQYSKEEKIASDLQSSIEKVTARMTFPQLGYFEESQLLEELNQYYKVLSVLFRQYLNKKKIDSHFSQFFSVLQTALSDVVKLLCPHINKVDLKRIDDYIDERDLGSIKSDDLVEVPLLNKGYSAKKAAFHSVLPANDSKFFLKI